MADKLYAWYEKRLLSYSDTILHRRHKVNIIQSIEAHLRMRHTAFRRNRSTSDAASHALAFRDHDHDATFDDHTERAASGGRE